jgi:3-phosphoshikimate 1-carboxyvinyltransferase
LSHGQYSISGQESSQFISGLMLALPLLKGPSQICLTSPLQSKGYADMTIQTLRIFGVEGGFSTPGSQRYISPGEISVEGDWSNAAFWLCAGAMPGGNIEITGLNRESAQGDKEICAILEQIGARLTWQDNVLQVLEDKRHGVEIDARAIPDLVPALCAAAAVSAGETIVKNAERLRLKESDRLTATAQTLNALGANITEEAAGLRVQGVPRLKGGTVDAWGDHRIAMMAAIASLACEDPVTITGAQAVRKSYPGFWEKFRMLGKEVIIEE